MRFLFLFFFFISFTAQASLEWLAIQASSKEERTELANLGLSLETLVDDIVYVVVEKEFIQ